MLYINKLYVNEFRNWPNAWSKQVTQPKFTFKFNFCMISNPSLILNCVTVSDVSSSLFNHLFFVLGDIKTSPLEFFSIKIMLFSYKTTFMWELKQFNSQNQIILLKGDKKFKQTVLKGIQINVQEFQEGPGGVA